MPPASTKTLDLSDLTTVAEAILAETVRLGTGDKNLNPRPGQLAALRDICASITDQNKTDKHTASVAPTGVGKSFVYLSVAAAIHAVSGERSVISTESLALQAQIIDKDAPVVVQACLNITGVRPTFAVLKGFGNYACQQASLASAAEMIGNDRIRPSATSFPKMMKGRKLNQVDREARNLIAWALSETEKGAASDDLVTGDKAAYTGTMTDSRSWEKVSVSAADCIGAAHCQFSETCSPLRARAIAGEADIVITNHTLLAIQAANDVPVVNGGQQVGFFNHAFIDEAHALINEVRNQGAKEFSGPGIRRLARLLRTVLDDRDPQIKQCVDEGDALADAIEEIARDYLRNHGRREPRLRLGEGQDPFEDHGAMILSWLLRASAYLKAAHGANSEPRQRIKIKRVRNRVSNVAEALKDIREHQSGTARWIEVVPARGMNSEFHSVKVAPVDVSGLMKFGLWNRGLTEDEKDERIDNGVAPDELADMKVPITVHALSATLPVGFTRDFGIRCEKKEYASPFDKSYGKSVLFVPRVSVGHDTEILGNQYGKFDTRNHQLWAAPYVLDLVDANEGSALVLAATAANGQAYAAALRQKFASRNGGHPKHQVLSQWDGRPARIVVAEWKADPSAVLVGTRSFFTGIDAAGETCSLVVIDRPARAASNPIDDARVEALKVAGQYDQWTADRFVYVADAAVLLEQSAGRLIRSVSDSGMVAVLDPRLVKSNPNGFVYPEPTRKVYMDALHRFTHKLADVDQAVAWLKARSAASKSELKEVAVVGRSATKTVTRRSQVRPVNAELSLTQWVQQVLSL